MTGKYIGRVKWYNTKKGYGFIVRGAGEEIFFHKSATVGEMDEFEEGQWVLYDVETTNKGPEATDVLDGGIVGRGVPGVAGVAIGLPQPSLQGG